MTNTSNDTKDPWTVEDGPLFYLIRKRHEDNSEEIQSMPQRYFTKGTYSDGTVYYESPFDEHVLDQDLFITRVEALIELKTRLEDSILHTTRRVDGIYKELLYSSLGV